ncbi:MAG: hypothetical protein PUK59_06040 [Actinomycetaceae bacterium]|nr:hypothetical protein [Actinomycetaceae bacterium]MDY5855150.1 hypothetical protein [Arcanobacterium sp.]
MAYVESGIGVDSGVRVKFGAPMGALVDIGACSGSRPELCSVRGRSWIGGACFVAVD